MDYPKQPLPYPCSTCKYKQTCGSPRTRPCKGYERKTNTKMKIILSDTTITDFIFERRKK